MFKFFTITCEQANKICNKAQYGEASFIEKIKLNFHILVCKFCVTYSKQNSMLTKICDHNSKEKEIGLTTDEKESLKSKLKTLK